MHLSTYACVYLEVSPSDLLLFSSVMNLPWTRTRCPRTHCHTNTHTHAITELNRINNWVQFRLKLKGKFTGWVCSTDSHICVGRMAYRLCAVLLNNSHTHDYSNAQTRRSSSFTTTEKRLRTNPKKNSRVMIKDNNNNFGIHRYTGSTTNNNSHYLYENETNYFIKILWRYNRDKGKNSNCFTTRTEQTKNIRELLRVIGCLSLITMCGYHIYCRLLRSTSL